MIVKKEGYKNYFHTGPQSAKGWQIAQLHQSLAQPMVVLIDDASQTERLASEIAFFIGDDAGQTSPVIRFPDWETLPYDYFSPHQDIVSERLRTLYQLPRLSNYILLLPVDSALQKLAPRNYIEQHCLVLENAQHLEMGLLSTQLTENGYYHVSTVSEHGEYAVRGSIIDLFPMGSNAPIRIELFDDEIESIRYFDAETQLTTEKTDKVVLLPGREFPTNDEAISRFRQNWRSMFESDIKQAEIYQEVSQGRFPAGIEYYLPLFHEATQSLFDFLDRKAIIVSTSQQQGAVDAFQLELSERYEQRAHDVTRPILEPKALYLSSSEFNQQMTNFTRVVLSEKQREGANNQLLTTPLPNIQIDARSEQHASRYADLSLSVDKTLICAESLGRQQAVIELLAKQQLKPQLIENWPAFLAADSGHYITVAAVDSGFAHHDWLVIAESDLFGGQVLQRRSRSEKSVDPDQLIHSLAELKSGDPVVHIEQGVGRYIGLQTIEAGGIATEFLTLEYQGGDKLYVPVQDLHLIHRYSGASPETAPWHKLGTESWSRAKNKAMEKARDTAAELLDLYARRASSKGIAHQISKVDYEKFGSEFGFQPTDDQITAFENVFSDMSSQQPMDRLICGDVGFGKTEVAMRAAFIAAQSGHQVAMLVPTTLLAQQHYDSFVDRFAQWPVNVAVLSRFQTKKEQEQTLQQLESGQIDIVIGTHRLLNGSPKFHNLGLLLIDEEHRFGVRQKEMLKSYRSKVDILTLTATPIPRTLNMSMSGMRDLSIIATPPAKRLSIKTFVRQRNKPLIKEAIQREMRRGGQVYFLHNSVETIHRVAAEIQELLPDIQIGVAHGQMRERELEDVMKKFYHQRFHVLICTTIIETGIDVPTANTIIMDRADKLGLAQLHQLRGRVGRSHHQAYAYLLIPGPKLITKDAQKRLQAIEELEDLGAGFILATHDLEIRGAGELLGDEQSGHMQTIGFSLYIELLERAVKALKEGGKPSLDQLEKEVTEVNPGLSAILPDDYVPDVSIRLSLYKRIASARDQKALRDIQVELIDRFGLLPQSTKNLFAIAALKLKLTPMGVKKLDVLAHSIVVEFSANPAINTDKLIYLIQTNPGLYKLEKGTVLRINKTISGAEAIVAETESLIETLSL